MYEDITPEAIKAEMIAAMPDASSALEGGFLDSILSPIAYRQWLLYMEMDKILNIMFMSTSDGDYIVKKCEEEGIFRHSGTVSTGEVTFYGSDNVNIPAGTYVETSSGLQFVTTEAAFISSGSVTAAAQSVEPGADKNVKAAAITFLTVRVSGVTRVTNAAAFSGGTDEESIESLKNRYLEAKSTTPASGNAADYEKWAAEVDGVASARVIPLWNGAGTVKVILVGSSNTAVSQSVVNAAAEYIEERRPIGADVTVVAAERVGVKVKAVLEGDETAEFYAARLRIETALKKYLETFDGGKIYINKIISVIMSEDKITNCSSVTLNDAAEDLCLTSEQIPYLSAIIWSTEGEE